MFPGARVAFGMGYEALTLQGRLLVEPLAGERQSYWGSTKGWERRRLEGGLNPWQDLKDEFTQQSSV